MRSWKTPLTRRSEALACLGRTARGGRRTSAFCAGCARVRWRRDRARPERRSANRRAAPPRKKEHRVDLAGHPDSGRRWPRSTICRRWRRRAYRRPRPAPLVAPATRATLPSSGFMTVSLLAAIMRVVFRTRDAAGDYHAGSQLLPSLVSWTDAVEPVRSTR